MIQRTEITRRVRKVHGDSIDRIDDLAKAGEVDLDEVVDLDIETLLHLVDGVLGAERTDRVSLSTGVLPGQPEPG